MQEFKDEKQVPIPQRRASLKSQGFEKLRFGCEGGSHGQVVLGNSAHVEASIIDGPDIANIASHCTSSTK